MAFKTSLDARAVPRQRFLSGMTAIAAICLGERCRATRRPQGLAVGNHAATDDGHDCKTLFLGLSGAMAQCRPVGGS
jgi:hypothetical protein